MRRNIGVVFQEALLFNRSIAENLRVGKPDATEAEMRTAVERAQALQFVDTNLKSLPTGLASEAVHYPAASVNDCRWLVRF